MKFWALAGLLTGLVLTTLILSKQNPLRGRGPQPVRAQPNTDQRYAVDDFVADLEA